MKLSARAAEAGWVRLRYRFSPLLHERQHRWSHCYWHNDKWQKQPIGQGPSWLPRPSAALPGQHNGGSSLNQRESVSDSDSESEWGTERTREERYAVCSAGQHCWHCPFTPAVRVSDWHWHWPMPKQLLLYVQVPRSFSGNNIIIIITIIIIINNNNQQ